MKLLAGTIALPVRRREPLPRSASTLASMVHLTASASRPTLGEPNRPGFRAARCAGTPRPAAASAPISTTQRQPVMCSERAKEKEGDWDPDEADRLIDRKCRPRLPFASSLREAPMVRIVDAEAQCPTPSRQRSEAENALVCSATMTDAPPNTKGATRGEDRPAPVVVDEGRRRIVPKKRPVNKAAMKLATPVVPKRPACLRCQYAGLDQARRDVSGGEEVVELEEHAKAEQHDIGPYWCCVAGSRSMRAEMVPLRSSVLRKYVVHVSSPWLRCSCRA